MSMRNESTEFGVISQLLTFGEEWDKYSDLLHVDLFTHEESRLIFSAIKRLADKGELIDVVSVSRTLGDAMDIEDLLGIAGFHDSSPVSLPRNIRALSEMAMVRKLHKAAFQIAEIAQDKEGADIAERLERAKSCLDELEFSNEEVEYKDAATIAMEHQEVLENRESGKAVVFPTGFFELDELLGGGLEPGKLMVVGARPSMGKSAIALNCGLNMATSGISTAFMSMEMPYIDVADRQFAILGKAKMQHLRQPSKGLEWERVVEAAEKSMTLPFYVTEKTGVNINFVRSFARKMKRRHGLKILVIDYLGLMKGTNQKLDKRFQIEEITQGLKTLAKELGIAIILLAQLNRDADAHPMEIPGLKTLADSASIERDADIIGFLHRPIMVNPDLAESFKNFAVFRIAKNRQGTTGDVNFFYRGEVMGFEAWGGQSPIAAAKSSVSRPRGL